MKMKRFLHIITIIFSSFMSLLAHGQGKPGKKIGRSELSKSQRDASHSADDDSSDPPPLRIDASLMASAQMSTPLPMTSFTPPTPHPGDVQSRYPWKYQIVTTTFWIGELPGENNPVPNLASSWDPDWTKKYGGPDDPNPQHRTAEFIPATFKPGQNPFYIALPYNDKLREGHKPEASKVIPWFQKDYKGPGESVCKGRWIAIRFGNKVCYAQWEDAGPFRTDHWQYVFGDERPKPNLNQGAGLDVSPAVRDYLGMNGTDVTDWRFVDFDEVPVGPWSKFGDNNTFVQNARKAQERVVSNASPTPVPQAPVAPDQF